MKKGRILGVLLAAAMAFGGVTGAVGTKLMAVVIISLTNNIC